MNPQELIQAALDAKKHAYVPYSKFPVGAALLTKSGKIYTGCNVEIGSIGLTICAERTAVVKAVSEGEKEFSAICCVADTEEYCSPCGACRQFIAEFGMDTVVIMANKHGDYKTAPISGLLPHAFVLDKELD
ncbi:cytidine deaminase [Zhaonella formicivorans]|jgi:cytidine deaminase|uniref:cytidine deaminase n=1 Tax=Zhaonella formicivorans TaxID=2528593 RepID=UPI0010F25BA5|nr:cytidine deaminase [Zhaonella formicivorans]